MPMIPLPIISEKKLKDSVKNPWERLRRSETCKVMNAVHVASAGDEFVRPICPQYIALDYCTSILQFENTQLQEIGACHVYGRRECFAYGKLCTPFLD